MSIARLAAAAISGLFTLLLVSAAWAGTAKLLSGEEFVRGTELYLSLLSAKAPGLVAAPSDFTPSSAPAACSASRQPLTYAVLVGAEDIGMGTRFILKGPKHDIELLGRALSDRGVAPERIHTLAGKDAKRERIVSTLRDVIAQAGCGDRVIFQFSGHAVPVREVAEAVFRKASSEASGGEEGRFFDAAVREDMLSRLDRAHPPVLKQGEPLADVAKRIATLKLALDDDLALMLSGETPDFHETIRGRDISDAVVAIRNRGAHAVVLLDCGDAARAAVERRQREAGDQAQWVFALGDAQGSYWPPVPLAPDHGSFTALYAADAGRQSPELPLPRGAPAGTAKVYGYFTYVVASRILGDPLATPRKLADTISETYVRDGKGGYHPRIESSNPDLVLVAEVAPPAEDPIRIISPKAMRGAAAVEKAEVEVEGLVEASAALIDVTVDGIAAPLQAGNRFKQTVPLKPGLNTLNITAVTAEPRLFRKKIELVYGGDKKALEGSGRHYAVIIANQDYGPATGMPNLATPFADADALADVLRSKYGFETQLALEGGKSLPLVLKDATKRQIETALFQIGKVAGAKDTVLIFYAGHGVFEQMTSIAYWVPSDAEVGFEPSYLSAADISAAVQRIQAASVILISDSCYSGALLRGAPPEAETISEEKRTEALLKLQSRRSRILITSGNNEPVADAGGGGHSVFARALLSGLEGMDHEAFSARELFDGFVLQQVTANSSQEPQFRPLDRAGHEGGDFVFVRRPVK